MSGQAAFKAARNQPEALVRLAVLRTQPARFDQFPAFFSKMLAYLPVATHHPLARRLSEKRIKRQSRNLAR